MSPSRTRRVDKLLKSGPLNRDPLIHPAVSGLNWAVGRYSFGCSLSYGQRVLCESAIDLIGMREIRVQEVTESVSFP